MAPSATWEAQTSPADTRLELSLYPYTGRFHRGHVRTKLELDQRLDFHLFKYRTLRTQITAQKYLGRTG